MSEQQKTARPRAASQRVIDIEISERELKTLRAILARIQIEERVWPGPGVKGTRQTEHVGVRLPSALVAQLDQLPGPRTQLIERAVKLFLMAQIFPSALKDTRPSDS